MSYRRQHPRGHGVKNSFLASGYKTSLPRAPLWAEESPERLGSIQLHFCAQETELAAHQRATLTFLTIRRRRKRMYLFAVFPGTSSWFTIQDVYFLCRSFCLPGTKAKFYLFTSDVISLRSWGNNLIPLFRIECVASCNPGARDAPRVTLPAPGPLARPGPASSRPCCPGWTDPLSSPPCPARCSCFAGGPVRLHEECQAFPCS